MITKKKSSDT